VQNYTKKSTKTHEKKVSWSANITETDDSQSHLSNDFMPNYNETHQVVNPNNLNEFSLNKEPLDSSAIKPVKTSVKVKRKPGRPAKRGRKKKESKLQKDLERTTPKAPSPSREEKKLEYYNNLIKRQEERELKKLRRKERKIRKQELQNSISDTSSENLQSLKGNKINSQRSNFVNNEEENHVKLEIVDDVREFINPHQYE